MDPTRGDSRYNLNYSMSSIGLSLADQVDMYGGNPAAVAALGGRPPSGGLIQSMGGGGGGGLGLSSRPSGLMTNTSQCQTLTNSSANSTSIAGQHRGIKRAGSDCYDDPHSNRSVMAGQSMQALESCGPGGNGQHGGQQQQQQSGGNVPDVVDDSYSALQNKKSPPANGKKTKGRVKIKMEYIDNKLRRYTTFSKRKTGIMKKAYELSTLTGTQVMLLVASETGHVYTFATRKLQPMITSEAGKQLIQTCLNSPDPPSVGGGDQRMSATGFEETELSYNIADEDSKDDRSPSSSANESDESSDLESPGPALGSNCKTTFESALVDAATTSRSRSASNNPTDTQKALEPKRPTLGYAAAEPKSSGCTKTYHSNSSVFQGQKKITEAAACSSSETIAYPASALANIPQEVLFQLIQSGHLQLQTEEDGSNQYVAIPLTTVAAKFLKSNSDIKPNMLEVKQLAKAATNRSSPSASGSVAEQLTKVPNNILSEDMIKKEFD